MWKVVDPTKPGTSAPTWTHWKFWVVAPQRSGAPNSSSSRSRVAGS